MNRTATVVTTHAVCLLIGGAVGYLIASSYFNKRYDELEEVFDEEIKDYKDDAVIGRRYRDNQEVVDTSQELTNPPVKPSVIAYRERISSLEYSSSDRTPTEMATAKVLLNERDPDNSDAPYLISVDLFNEEGSRFEKITMTYFEGDEVLADDKEQMVVDIEALVGKQNLTRFGECDPDDTDVIYVRNEKLEVDFEVFREDNAYSHVVLNLDEDYLQPNTKTAHPKKMRQDV